MFKKLFKRKISTPNFYIGKDKDIYTGDSKQRTWIKNHISKTMIWTNNNWELHSISVGVNHPLFNEINAMLEIYKSKNPD